MLASNAKATVCVSLIQVGVTVFGVLVAAASQKAARMSGRAQVFSSEFLMDLSLWLLALPLVWITLVTVARSRPQISDDTKRAFFLSGFLLLVTLLAFVLYAAVWPWTMPMAGQG